VGIRFTLGAVAVVASSALLAAVAAALPARHAAVVQSVNVDAGTPSEFKFTLSKRSVSRGVVTFNVADQGALPHTFWVCSKPNGPSVNACNGKGAQVLPGSVTAISIVFTVKGRYEYLCTLPGHAAAGMKGFLTVR
jgi:uncharacterized cupredoxin-like copper-binding protein